MRFRMVLIAAVCLLPVAGARPLVAQTPAATPGAVVKRPLAHLAEERILVLPARYLTFGDSLGWSTAAGAPAAWLAGLDDEIAYALRERGLGTSWIFPAAIERQATAAGGLIPDPRALQASSLRSGGRRDAPELVPSLASELRAVAALTDARYVLYPVEVQTAGGAAGAHATLHVVVLDARDSQVVWSGDVTGTSVRQFSPAVAAELASKLGELIAPVAH